MKQLNTENQLWRLAAREQMGYHGPADRLVSFRGMTPGFTMGFAAPSLKCLLREAHRRNWPMGPSMRRLARAAAAAAAAW